MKFIKNLADNKETMKMNKIWLILGAVLLIATGVQAANLSINAGAENNAVGVNGGRVYNQNGVGAGNELPVGSALQYIYAGPDNTINPPDSNGAVTGDDVLLVARTVGSDSVWSTFTSVAGQFYHGASGTYSSGTPKVYVRAWNAASIAAATRYGDSALLDPATDANNPPMPNDVGINNFSTATVKPAPAQPAPSISGISWDLTDGTPATPANENALNANYVYGTIIINGTNFGADPGNGNRDSAANRVTISGLLVPDVTPDSGIEVYFWSNTSISVGVPLSNEAGSSFTVAGSKSIVVTAGGQASNSVSLAVRPRVYGLGQTSGAVGSSVTINGTAFGTNTANISVSFNGTAAVPSSAGNTTLSVNVPSGATSGALTVTVNSQNSNANYDNGDPINFTVMSTPPPAVNNPPAAQSGSASATKNTAVAITLSATDADGNPLTYSIVANPANGTLGAVSGNQVTYTPNNNYVGADSFTFKANDGTADSNTATVSITVTDTVTPPPSTAPSIGAIAPTSASIGQTIVISGANFGATKGTSSVTIGGMTANPTAWSAASITLAVPSGVATGAASVAVTVSGQTANSSITIDGSKIVIDDIEGGSVGTWTIDNDNSGSADSGYYTFDDGMMAPTNNNITSQGPDASAAKNGTKGMKVKFSYVQNADPAKDWGDGWGAAVSRTLDLSTMKQVVMNIKWDGSSNALKLSFQDSGRHIYAATVSNATLAAVSGYGQIAIPLASFAEDTENASRTAGAVNWSQITNYNIAYLNKGTTANYQNIDDITALSTTEITTPPPAPTATGEAPAITTVTPAQAPAGIRIAVSGARFGSTQGSSTLIFENTSTHVAYPAEIISWSDTSIEAIAPRLATAGNYTIKVNRVANAAGAVTALESNPAAFQVTASAAAEIATLYPNPFNPNAQAMTLAITNTGGAANIGFYIYDMTARLVFKRVITASSQTTWTGYDTYNAQVADGAYILRVVNEDTKTLLAKGKILVVKR